MNDNSPNHSCYLVKKVLSGYFGNSPATLLSLMINEEKLSRKEIEKMKEIIKQIK